jgi:GNAT superfamily N-acetyltransferase
MAENIEIHVLRKGELKSGNLPANWEDPDGHAKPPPHLMRLFLDNPLSKSDDDPCRALALVDNNVAGHVGLLVGEVIVDEHVVPVLWGFDLFISPRFRGRRLASRLLKCWQDLHHTTIGTNVNLDSLKIYQNLGWTEFYTPGYFIIHRSRRFLEAYLRAAPLAALASPLVDAGLSALRGVGRLRGPGPKHKLRAEAVEVMPDDFDTLLADNGRRVKTHRSASYINYWLRVAELDDAHDLRLCLVGNGDGEPVGYFLLQRKPSTVLRDRFEGVNLVLMRDWGIFDLNRADALSITLAARDYFFEWGGDAFVATLHDVEDGRALRALGFRDAGPLRTMFHAVPPSPLAGDENMDQRFWHFTAAEADGLFI